MTPSHAEFAIARFLRDPMIRALMQADGVQAESLADTMRRAACAVERRRLKAHAAEATGRRTVVDLSIFRLARPRADDEHDEEHFVDLFADRTTSPCSLDR